MKQSCIIKGGYGLGNFGDDALMYWAVNIVEKKVSGAKIYLDCYPASYIKRFVNVSFDIKQADKNSILIYGGGTLFYNFPKNNISKFKKLLNSIKKPKKIIRKLQIEVSSKLFRKQIAKKIMLGMGFGPFYSKESQAYKSAIAEIKSSDEVIVRDSKAFSFAVNYKENIMKCSDICFASIDGVKFIPNNFSSVNKIAFVLRDWESGTSADNYFTSTYEAAKLLRENGFIVEFISFSKSSDSKLNKKIIDFGEEIKIWDPTVDSINEFIEFLSKYSAIVSSRFHGLVFSTLLEIPSIAIAIEEKLDSANENSACLLWDPIKDKPLDLLKLITAISADYDTHKQYCKNTVIKNRAAIDSAINLAFDKSSYISTPDH